MPAAFDKMGGRKFLMGIIVMLIGAAIEINSPKGLSTEMAALITMIYATFSASNAIVTNKQLSVQTSEAGPVPTNVVETPIVEQQPPPASSNDVAIIQEQLNNLGPLLNQFAGELANLKNNQVLHAQSLNTVQKAVLSKNAL